MTADEAERIWQLLKQIQSDVDDLRTNLLVVIASHEDFASEILEVKKTTHDIIRNSNKLAFSDADQSGKIADLQFEIMQQSVKSGGIAGKAEATKQGKVSRVWAGVIAASVAGVIEAIRLLQ